MKKILIVAIIAGVALLLIFLSFSQSALLQSLVKVTVISIALILLLGQALVILNLYRASNPVRYLFKKGMDAFREMSTEDRDFLLHFLEMHKELTEKKEKKIEIGEMQGNMDECRKRKYLIQTWIDKIKAFPSDSIHKAERSGIFNYHSF